DRIYGRRSTRNKDPERFLPQRCLVETVVAPSQRKPRNAVIFQGIARENRRQLPFHSVIGDALQRRSNTWPVRILAMGSRPQAGEYAESKPSPSSLPNRCGKPEFPTRTRFVSLKFSLIPAGSLVYPGGSHFPQVQSFQFQLTVAFRPVGGFGLLLEAPALS